MRGLIMRGSSLRSGSRSIAGLLVACAWAQGVQGYSSGPREVLQGLETADCDVSRLYQGASGNCSFAFELNQTWRMCIEGKPITGSLLGSISILKVSPQLLKKKCSWMNDPLLPRSCSTPFSSR